jgi:hypothetical protein
MSRRESQAGESVARTPGSRSRDPEKVATYRLTLFPPGRAVCVLKSGRTSGPVLPQAVHTNFAAMSASAVSSGQRSALIRVLCQQRGALPQ